MTDISKAAPWPDTTTATADQLARFYTTRAMWSYGVAETSHDRPFGEFKAATTAFVDGHTVARLLRELIAIDPDRANALTRELLGNYELMPTPLCEVGDWLAEYGLDADAIKDAGIQAAREQHQREAQEQATAETAVGQ